MSFQNMLLSTSVNLFFFFVVYSICRVIYSVYFHPLSKFPGPKWYAASHLPIRIATIRGILPFKIRELHERYGDVVRIAPCEISICSAAALQYTLNQPGLPKDPKVYTPGEAPNIFTAHSKLDHTRHRQVLSHAFSEKALREQEPLIKSYIDLLVSKLHQRSGKPQNMAAWFNFVTFDIIGDLTIGESFNCLEEAKLHPWVEMLFKYFKASLMMSVFLAQFPVLKVLFPLVIPKEAMKSRRQHVAFTREMVGARIERETERPDFMSNILRHNEKGNGLSKDEIVATSGFLLVAGSETTATLLSAVMYHLLMNPEVMAKLVNEIRTSFKTEDEINMVSVNTLKYELAVLDEGMRMNPPVPHGSFRVTPPEGANIDGIWVPGGTSVGIALYCGQRRKSYWVDPDSFLPERWLGDRKYKSDNRAMFAPFSLGTRNCIGRNLANAEMRVILARLLWNFDLKIEEESRRWIDMKVFTLWERQPLMVKLTSAIRT